MAMYSVLKLVHVSAAVISISGFVLRGLWMLRGSTLLEHRLVRVLPHVIDTLLLLSGIALVWLMQLQVTGQPWLMAKLFAVVIYIGLGMVALRRGRTLAVRAVAFCLALATFAYIAGLALSKSLLSWLAIAIS